MTFDLCLKIQYIRVCFLLDQLIINIHIHTRVLLQHLFEEDDDDDDVETPNKFGARGGAFDDDEEEADDDDQAGLSKVVRFGFGGVCVVGLLGFEFAGKAVHFVSGFVFVFVCFRLASLLCLRRVTAAACLWPNQPLSVKHMQHIKSIDQPPFPPPHYRAGTTTRRMTMPMTTSQKSCVFLKCGMAWRALRMDIRTYIHVCIPTCLHACTPS